MKRFIFTVPLQPDGALHLSHYESGDGCELLKTERLTRFPIIIPMSKAVKKGEKINVTAILIDRDTVPNNYRLFKEELDALANEIGFEYELSEITMPNKEDAVTHVDLFKALARVFASTSDEELYACTTYGTKPMPMLLLMALTYAYKVCTGFTVEAIVYGAFDHSAGKSRIYDVSGLFYLNSAVNNMANLELEDPLKLIDEFTVSDGGEE